MGKVFQDTTGINMASEKIKDRICEFECNIDDMTAEELAYAAERLMAEGAKDVTLTPIQMKKGRPATLVTVMFDDDDDERERMARLIFQYTTTIGIREVVSERYVLDRREETVETPYGKVRCKVASGYGVKRVKAEYDDLARIADNRHISIAAAGELLQPYIHRLIDERKKHYV